MATANIRAVITAEDRSKNVLSGFSKGVQSTAQSISTGVNRAAKAFGLAAIAATTFAIKSASEFEQSRVAFDTMLGSAEAGKKMMQDLSDFARKTPFDLPEVVEGAKKLLAYGITAQDVLKDLKTLGDVSAGVGRDKLPMLTLAFGQVATKGKLFGQEIRQFTEAGVPLVQELAKALGKTTEEIATMSENGEIGFTDVRKALENMTGEGGKFFQLMERQSKTFGGTLSNLRDNVGRLARSIVGIDDQGQIRQGSIFAKLTEAAQSLLTWLDNNKEKITERTQEIVDSMMEKSRTFVQGFIETVKSEGFAVAMSQAFMEMLGKMDWVGMATTAVGLFLIIAPQIIEGFIRGLIQAFRDNPLDMIMIFALLGFTPAIMITALTTVLGGIPIVGPILSWVTKGMATTATLAKTPITAAFTALGSTAAGAIGIGFAATFAFVASQVYGMISSLKSLVNGEISKITGRTKPVIDRLRAEGKHGEANKLEGMLKDVQAGPKVPWLAEGGIVTRPTLAMIGEEGPEAVVPLNKRGGVGTTINVTFSGIFTGNELEFRELARKVFKAQADNMSMRGA